MAPRDGGAGKTAASPLRWFLAAVGGAFAVGLLAGLLLPGLVAAFAPAGDPGPVPDPLLRQLITTYRLDARQQLLLSAIEQARQRERDQIFEDEFGNGAGLPPDKSRQIQRRLEEVQDKANRRIAHILDAQQRAAWERDLTPVPVGGGAQGSGSGDPGGARDPERGGGPRRSR